MITKISAYIMPFVILIIVGYGMYKKSDNYDNLSAIVSVLIDADLLIILSDIDGFYDSNPKENPNAKLIKQIDEITEEIEACAGGAGSSLGTGGMATKIAAAHKATKAGVNMVLANGEEPPRNPP